MRELRGEDGERGDSLPATFSASSSAHLISISLACYEYGDKDGPILESSLVIASRIRLIVFSRLRRRVDGLVIVVPSEL